MRVMPETSRSASPSDPPINPSPTMPITMQNPLFEVPKLYRNGRLIEFNRKHDKL
jgi:hypothetical protein